METSRPNIVWITLDSVRADHTSLQGYHRDTTPALQQIADEPDGVAFEHCIAHSTRTPVSVPSMLTGTYPSHHQVGLGAGSCGKVPPSMATVPELLSECGYYTAAVSRNAYAGEATGLDRGFDEFVRPTLADDLSEYPHVLSLLKYGLGARRHSGGLTRDKQKHPKAFLINDVAKRVMKEVPDSRPFFLYLHYNEPHRPYYPPRSYRDRYIGAVGIDPAEALAFAEDMHENAYEYMAEGLPFSDQQWEILYAMYDAVIEYTDHCVGSLFEFVREQSDDTVLVVTADHGELFGERGLLGHHIVLDDALIHVPCVVAGLPEIAQHRDDVVQHIDIMQTLVSLAGGDTCQFQGVDLRMESREFAISQDLRETVDDERENYHRIRKHNSDFDTSRFHESLLTALRTTEYKLLHTDEWTRLHELPDETADVSDLYPEIEARLTKSVQNWLATDGQAFVEAPVHTQHSESMKRHLREMGYLE